MKYGDFSSLVQLGVGLHLGTALLQFYGDIGMAPLVRKLARIRQIVEDERVSAEIRASLYELESDYEIFKIQFFNEYKFYIKWNAAVAVFLVACLCFISFKNDEQPPALISVLLVYASIVPAPMTLAMLWGDAERAVAPLKRRAEELEPLALKNSP